MRVKQVSGARVLKTAGVCLLIALACAVLLPLAGSAPVDFRRALAGQSPDAEILFYSRVPRLILAMLAGGALSTAGVLFQALLRDALATPYTLGISSGASLGAVIAIVFGLQQTGIWGAAFAGAAITLFVVAGVASQGRRLSSFTLLLAGITVNSIALALILVFFNLASVGQSFAITRWIIGAIEPVSYTTLAWLSVLVLAGAVYTFWHARDWNLLAVGEEWAAVRGLSPTRVILAGYLAGSLLTGAATALTGPVGFVGLIVPHALRMKLGADHRLLVPASFLLGAAFLAVCDTIARTALAPAEIPAGVVTSLLGGPFFIWMLRSRRRSLWL
ncbi:MAG: iron ABC transporter permease [Acidobacteria bacterium]|nr:iron ABC transporter permease [Acidobacteriota bacterium]MBI3281223.1 iron ABC transporter permease [Acidobacteriota bacterium]